MLCYSLLLCVAVYKALNTCPNASYAALPKGVAITSSSCVPCLRLIWLLVTCASVRWPLICWLCVLCGPSFASPGSLRTEPSWQTCLTDVLEGLASRQLLFSSPMFSGFSHQTCLSFICWCTHVRPATQCDFRLSQPSWEKTVFGLWSLVTLQDGFKHGHGHSVVTKHNLW